MSFGHIILQAPKTFAHNSASAMSLFCKVSECFGFFFLDCVCTWGAMSMGVEQPQSFLIVLPVYLPVYFIIMHGAAWIPVNL